MFGYFPRAEFETHFVELDFTEYLPAAQALHLKVLTVYSPGFEVLFPKLRSQSVQNVHKPAI